MRHDNSPVHTRRRLGKLGMAVGAVLVARRSQAQDSWQVSAGDWFNAANWNQGIPTAGVTAEIDNDGVAQISSGSAAAGPEEIGYSVAGMLDQTGGTNTINGDNGLYLGHNANSTGTYAMSGGALNAIGTDQNGYSEYVGYSGTGNFNQTGGTNAASYIVLGANSGSSGTYALSAGTLTCAYAGIGQIGSGNLNQTGGSLTASDHYSVGDMSGASGGFSLSGNGILSAYYGDVGFQGTGIFNQAGGTNNINSGLYLGGTFAGGGGTGTYLLSGTGSLVVGGNEYVGYNGSGFFCQCGGTNMIIGDLDLGRLAGAAGNYTLNGGTLAASDVYVGGSGGGVGGSGNLTVSGTGVLNDDGALTVYNLVGDAVNLSGGTINVVSLDVNGAKSLFNWTSGTLGLTAGVTFDPAAAPTTTSAAFGSSLVLGADEVLAVQGNETVGGANAFSLTLNSGASNSVSGITTINGGSLLKVNGGALILRGPGVVNVGGTLTIQNQGTVDITNNALAINFGSPQNDPIKTIRGYLATGYLNGFWTGTGINSSTAATGSPGETLSVGYADGNTDTGTPAAPNQILIQYTLAGDANLDGHVNSADLLAVIQNFNKTGTDWSQGNFTYANSTGSTDLLLVIQNFNKTLTPGGSSGDSVGGSTLLTTGGSTLLTAGGSTFPLADSPQFQPTAVRVPEPAAPALLAAATAGLLTRRRRNAGLALRH
jgi:hypothetical protein